MSEASLELATFDVREVAEDVAPTWSGGRLLIDLSGLESEAAREPGLSGVAARVVRPGSSVRVVNVLDAVEPAVKSEDPDSTFPGALGRLAPAGRGRTHRLEGVAVIATCDLRAARFEEGQELPDSLVDMAGPGADRTPWGATTNVVLEFEPAAGASAADVDRAVRRVTLRTARDLAAATLGSAPDRTEVIEPRAPTAADDGFPRVCAILQVASEGPFLDTFLYGSPMLGMMPTLLDPRELLDGAVTSGTYDWAGVRNPTFLYQRNGLVRELLTSDGQRLRFAGLILALGYLDSGFEKQRSAMLAGGLALQLGADGAVCTTFGSGNSHTDTMLTVRACERLGIRTVAIVAETNGGLTDHVPEADVIVSTGNEDELVPGWEPAEIVGGATGVAAGSPVPAALYLGSVSEMGDLAWTAVPA